MIICGLKLTHDGAIAVLEDKRLLFSVEMEKLNNNNRYCPISDLEIVPQVLRDFGFKTSDIDRWAVDGWDGAKVTSIPLLNHGKPVELTVAPYREADQLADLLQPGYFGGLTIGNESKDYTSYTHLAGHLLSAYCTSEFARNVQPCFGLIWDGGTFPRLYYIDPQKGLQNGGHLFPLIGHSYATAAHHFGPFRRQDEAESVDDLSVAGKLMAYIGLGTSQPPVKQVLRDLLYEHFEAPTSRGASFRKAVGGWGSNAELSMKYLHAFYRDLRARLAPMNMPDEDVLASVHEFIEELLIDRLTARIRTWKGDGPWNLCFTGGCALNIKWNSALRASPLFSSVWVPPFPNDTGSAIGTAAAHLVEHRGIGPIDWHVYLGPDLTATPELPSGWDAMPCTPEELAFLLYDTGKPIVVLNHRAELGPRALGARSILATAADPAMKDILNEVKDRESYRPVAPLCLTDHAPQIFDPGTPDPYMLFEHRVRPNWLSRIPAVVHVDGTARLQTVSDGDDPVLARILGAYYRLSGIPVLCNTSANYNGRGFFPSVFSALEWGRIDTVWSAGTIFQQQGDSSGIRVPTRNLRGIDQTNGYPSGSRNNLRLAGR